MKYYKIIVAALLLGLSFSACDKVEAPYKETIIVEVNRKVLLEDYTGHKCVNCPAAHEIAHELQEIYGEDNLIMLAVHAGFFATPSAGDFSYDFNTVAGTEWVSYYSVEAYPSGMVDRMEYNGSPIIDKDKWASKIDEEFKKEASLGLSIESSITDRKISGDISIDFAMDLNSQAKIQILITEDSLIKPQVIPGGIDEEYVHMHVMRGAVNGSWGENLSAASYSAGDKETISFSNFAMGDDWVEKQLSVVAFVYDEESGVVLNVEKKKLSE